jgi:MFS family permease
MTAASANKSISQTPISRSFFAITAADLIVRSAYQMGKTPLLPIFAAALGATDLYIGFIVSVSTLTGMVLKPAVGLLSDRWGRRLWLLLGTTLFAIVPFFYLFIRTPEQLLAIRLVHGTATAIYGPVTVACVVELTSKRRGESIGWFSMARSGGYIIGPALGGLLLLTLSPQFVFTIIGGLSLLAFIPILLLGETHQRPSAKRRSWRLQLRLATRTATQSTALWLAGGLEMIMFVGLYAVKAFLPIYGLAIGMNAAQIGLYFAAQEGVTVLMKPLSGRLGDNGGHLKFILGGMALLALALILLSSSNGMWLLFLSAVLAGAGQAFIAPNTIGLLSNQLHTDQLGTSLGMLGTLQNGSKVAGPLLAGLLVTRFDYTGMFSLIGYLLLATTVLMALLMTHQRTRMDYRPIPLENREAGERSL